MLSPAEFSQRLKAHKIIRSAQTIRNWCDRGLPGAVKIGGTWEIEEATVEYVVSGKWDVRSTG